MRATLPFLVLVGGCLSAPTGRAPGDIDASDAPVDGSGAAWPPPAANIVAIGAGDLDADGKDDIIVADQGGGGRVFALRGGVDVDPTRPTVTTASRTAPLTGLRPPAAAIVAKNGTTPFVVILDNPATGPRLTIYDSQLAMVSQSSAGTTPAPAGAIVTLSQTTFGMGQNAVFGSIPDALFFIEGSSLPAASPVVMQLPEAGATPLPTDVRAVAGFVASGAPPSPTVVISEGDHAQKAISTGPGAFTWSTVRTTGALWSSQAAADITGDAYDDIVGFNPNSTANAQICLLDAAGGTTPNCYQTPFGMDAASIVVGPVVNATQDDVILTNVNPQNQTMTGVFVVANLRVAGSNVMADSAGAPTDFPVQDATVTLAQLDAAGKEIILVGRTGTIICARSNGVQVPSACQ
jgi:hypothetical protein